MYKIERVTSKGAIDQSNALGMRVYHHDHNPKVLVLNNGGVIVILHMDINWTRYFEMYIPE